MLDILRAELDKYQAFAPPSNQLVNALVRAVPFNTVPTKMKIVFAISHLSNFASQFRRNIKLWDDTLVPTNNISFVVADSGANKDSSNSKIKKCFAPGLDKVTAMLQNHVRSEAIKAATAAQEEMPQEFEVYKRYLKPVPPVFMSITTGPGLVQHINDIGALPAGSGMVYTGEVSDELANNINTLENIKILAEVYDLGDKEVTYTKNTEFRSKEIKGQPVSALFVGSPGHILYDEATRKKFHIAFMSKLARRSWFCYTPERIAEPDFSKEDNPIQAMRTYEYGIEMEAKTAIKALQQMVERTADENIAKLGEPIPVTEKVFELFTIYKRYNSEVVGRMSNHESVYCLVRRHLQWKALKLAGAFAVIENAPTVDVNHYITAIQYCEMFDKDISDFEKDLNKAPHESLADYLKTQVDDTNKAFIGIHDIKKHGFSVSVSQSKLVELVALCAGYDKSGIYSVAPKSTGIIYESLVVTDKINVSWKKLDNSKLHEAIANNADSITLKHIKQDIAKHSNTGYKSGETTFAALVQMLERDMAYAPFVFADGNRGKENIIGGTKWLVLDIDKTTLSYEEAHFILDGINHHIALTSDAKNKYKYRVLLELDSPVDLSPVAWKHFYLHIADALGLTVDPLPQSQIFFSYAGRPILSCLDGKPLAVRQHVMYAKEKEVEKSETAPKGLSNDQKNFALSVPRQTFAYAFETEAGGRSAVLYRAYKHARDLGASLEYTLDLITEINDFWVTALPPRDIIRFKEQVTREYGS